MAKGQGALIERYIKIRDAKKEIEERHKEELAPYKEQLEKIEAYFLNHFNEEEVDSVAIKGVGTAFKQVRTGARVADWDAVLKFILEGDHIEMLEKRVSKAAVEAYRDEFKDLPPGIDWTEVAVVNIRRKK